MNITDLIPPQYKIMAIGIAAAVVLAGAFGAGWVANGWRLHAEISDLKAEHATESAKQSQDALKDLADASKKVKENADAANVEVGALGDKLDAIHKELKNAKPAPLPAGCVLDDVRLRNIAAAVSAVNETVAGLRISQALQTAPGP